MKAFTVAVQSACQHGVRLTAIFTMADDRAKAISAGVVEAFKFHHCDTAGIAGTAAYEIHPDVVREAAAELEKS